MDLGAIAWAEPSAHVSPAAESVGGPQGRLMLVVLEGKDEAVLSVLGAY